MVGMSNIFFPIIIINKPEPLSDLYLNKNKYVDKEPITKEQFKILLGESSLMVKGSEEQMRKRKIIGSSFYKEKLMKMVEIVNQCVADKVAYMEERFLAKNEAFNLISEIDELHTRIILTSAFGMDRVSDLKLPYIENGVTIMRPLGEVLRDVFLYIALKGLRTETCFIPYLSFFFYT
jgi:hypothetical protein